MTEEQRKSKFNLMKILSLACLVVIIVSGFLPWVTLGGDYKDGVLGELSAITSPIPEDQIDEMQDMLDEQDIDLDIQEFVDLVEGMTDPITDGAVAPMDFMALYSNFNALVDYMEKVSEIDELGVAQMDAETLETFSLASTMLLTPVVVFGVLALAAAIRLILRLFNRRGLGVLVAILSALNALFMFGVSFILDMFVGQTGNAFASVTPVPVVVFVCSILGCVFWAQARKLLNPVVVKEVVEIPVPQNIPAPQNVVVEPVVAPVVEEEVTEAEVETVEEEVEE